jgi:hypothetical protein
MAAWYRCKGLGLFVRALLQGQFSDIEIGLAQLTFFRPGVPYGSTF